MVDEALEDADWIIAMQDELNSFTRNKVWSLVERPSGNDHNIIGTKWIFKNKQDEHGTIIRNKARLVVQGTPKLKAWILMRPLPPLPILNLYTCFLLMPHSTVSIISNGCEKCFP